jgi:hypothetical protein
LPVPIIERVWWRSEPPLDRETVDGLIAMLMGIDEKIERVLERLDGEDAEEDDT